MSTPPKSVLGIHEITPIDMNDEAVKVALAMTQSAIQNPKLNGILRLRTAIQQFLCNALIADGYVHPPIYMLAGCTDPLNHQTFPARVNYYGEEISVTQSLILQKMLMVMLSGADKVFWASPNIRMEMGVSEKNYKYVSEFMQVDFEKRGATYGEMLETLSKLMSGLYQHLNETQADVLTDIRGSLLPVLSEPLQVFDAQAVKKARGFDKDAAVERWGGAQTDGKPFIVINLKREAYDCYDEKIGRYLNFDVIVPPFGNNPNPVECLSGAERTRSISDLKQRMADLNYPEAYFAPFFTLFESLDKTDGKITCAGAGFGIERLTFALLGLENVHQVYPFPRPAEAKIAI
jgi:aspartyl/asparaginyl-tRNA synthetase